MYFHEEIFAKCKKYANSDGILPEQTLCHAFPFDLRFESLIAAVSLSS